VRKYDRENILNLEVETALQVQKQGSTRWSVGIQQCRLLLIEARTSRLTYRPCV